MPREYDTTNEMKFLIQLRTALFPRPVSSIIADATKLVDELRLTAEEQIKRRNHHEAMAYIADTEAQKAKRIAGKISELVS